MLEVGKGILLPGSEFVESVFVADTSIADANLSPSESVFLFGKSVGETSLIGAALNGDELFRYTIVVTENISELRRSLSRRFPGEALSLESSRGSILVTGTTSTEQVRQNVIRTVEAAVPSSAIIDELTVASSNLIRLKVRLLEVNRSRVSRFGVDWTALIADNGFTLGTSSRGNLSLGYDETAENSLNATVDLLVSNGVASIVQETSLSTVSGKDAEFSVGGEIPVPTFTGDTEVNASGNFSLDYKFIGTRLLFTPAEAKGNKLRLAISSSVTSAQATSSTVNGNVFPNLSTRSFRTDVELADKQSFVIAGLSKNETLSALRDPAGNAPSRLINSILGRDTVNDTGQELVIIVTPFLSDFEPPRVAEAIIRRPSNLEYILGGGTQGGKHPGLGRLAPVAGFRY
ncbi:MAG: type II and III secretion system protein family protein [Paracoccaceae bacterium]